MSDLIDRQAAIDTVHKAKDKSEAHRMLVQLPPAQPVEDARAMCGECDAWNQYKNHPQPGWIPCSKQLPKKSGLYIITQQTPIEEDSVDIIYFNKRNDGGIWSGVRSEKVLAWKEKPKPYRPEGDIDNVHKPD